MGKKIITGRIALAVLLCAVLLMNKSPLVSHAATWNFSNENMSYDKTFIYASDGMLDTSHDSNLYGGEDRNKSDTAYDGHYSTDISDQINSAVGGDSLGDTIKNSLEQNYAVDIISNLIYFLATSLHHLFDEIGIALDNVIFGRVGGHGTRVFDAVGDYWANDIVVSLFHFELESGNPYGVIAAMIYNAIRKYLYIIMIVVAFGMFVKIAGKGDIPRAKLDFKDKLYSSLEIFALMVFMPYFLEIGLYIRDLLLKGIVGNSILGLFGSSDFGLLNTFKDNCNVSWWSDAPALMASILYFAAVCISLVLAAMYVANSLAMLVQVVAFPVVCVKSLFDKRALGNWVMEMIGLASIPIIDGTLLMVPLIFAKASNGAVGLNFISLLMCGSMLTVRQQFRKALGLQSNNMLESGGLMTAMGMARLISSVGRAGKRAIGQATGGFKQGASDDAMANYYEAQAKMDEFNKKDAEAQVDNGYFNARGGVAENPAAKTGMGAGMGLSGDLMYKAQKLNDINAKLSTPHETSADNVYASDMTNVAPSSEKTKRAQDLRNAQVSAVMGKKAPVQDDVAEAFANIDNFESQEFANKLSNAKKAQLYRERAKNARTQGVKSALATAGGATVGGITAFAATAYMDSGTSAMITSAGVDLGASAGPALSNVVTSRRMSKDAKDNRTIIGEGSELGYAIKKDENGTRLFTYSRFNDQEGERLEADIPMTDLPAVHKAEQKDTSKGEMVTAEGWYETNGAKIADAYESAVQTEVSLSGEVSAVNGSIGVVSSQEGVKANVDIKQLNNAKNDVREFLNQHENLKQSIVDNFDKITNMTWNNSELIDSGDTNYGLAEKASLSMRMNANLTPQEKAEGNKYINDLKDDTYKKVFVAMQRPLSASILHSAQQYGIEIPQQMQSSLNVVVNELVKERTMDYVEQHNWHFDSLKL